MALREIEYVDLTVNSDEEGEPAVPGGPLAATARRPRGAGRVRKPRTMTHAKLAYKRVYDATYKRNIRAGATGGEARVAARAAALVAEAAAATGPAAAMPAAAGAAKEEEEMVSEDVAEVEEEEEEAEEAEEALLEAFLAAEDDGEVEDGDSSGSDSDDDENMDDAIGQAAAPQAEMPMGPICCICLEGLMIKRAEGIKTVVLVKCGHTFCEECLDLALLFKKQCPYCRTHCRTSDKLPIILQ